MAATKKKGIQTRQVTFLGNIELQYDEDKKRYYTRNNALAYFPGKKTEDIIEPVPIKFKIEEVELDWSLIPSFLNNEVEIRLAGLLYTRKYVNLILSNEDVLKIFVLKYKNKDDPSGPGFFECEHGTYALAPRREVE